MNLFYLCQGKRERELSIVTFQFSVNEVINDLGNRSCEVEILILRVLAANGKKRINCKLEVTVHREKVLS